MVARLTQIFTWKDVWRFTQPLTVDPSRDNLRPLYNAAPTDELLIIRLDKNGRREDARVRWGLIPGMVEERRQRCKVYQCSR